MTPALSFYIRTTVTHNSHTSFFRVEAISRVSVSHKEHIFLSGQRGSIHLSKKISEDKNVTFIQEELV